MADESPARAAERILQEAGYTLVVEDAGDRLIVHGMVGTEGDRDAVLDVVHRAVPSTRVEPDITVAGAYPGDVREGTLSEVEVGAFPGADPDLEDAESVMPGDFADQTRVTSPLDAQPSSLSGGGRALTTQDEVVTSGEAAYIPPTDPVGTDREVIGGFAGSSMDSMEVQRSSDGALGDEAIADAVRRELREDAATTALELEVEVERGVVALRGRVEDLDEVESAEEVAARVPGVVDVVEDLFVIGLSEDERET